MKTTRTSDEIIRQINGLKKDKEIIPRKSMFGDDNWAKIDAQISVLEGKSKPDDFYIDESAEEYQDGDNDTFFAASKAEDWLKGHETEDLFDND